MAKRQNYGFQKRQKEADKQKKKDEKAEKKRVRKESGEDGSTAQEDTDADEEDDPAESWAGPPQPAPRETAVPAVSPVTAASSASSASGVSSVAAASPAPPVAGRRPGPDRPTAAGAPGPEVALEPELRARLATLCDEGWDLWADFDTRVRQASFHPFVAADYQVVLGALLPLRGAGLRFLEWGSATGVITIMADLLGFEACGIEIDPALVEQARVLAARNGSRARFVAGSFLPTGYRWRDRDGDQRLGTISDGESGYLALGMPLEDFDIVFGYPWPGEEPMMLDLMRAHGRRDARFLVHSTHGVKVFQGGRLVV